jgi:uncharacterized RDD family membrane protein YckC
MRRTIQTSSSSDLFDLPLLLDPPSVTLDELVTTRSGHAEPAVEPAVEPSTSEPEQIALPEESNSASETTSGDTMQRRLRAGAVDVALAGAALAAAVAGAAVLGVAPRLAYWPAYAVVGLTLSFVYAVYSLSFWARTPGMARVGLSARTAAGRPITFGQAVRRWLGGIVTVGLLGLPLLLLVRRRVSLADALSGTRLES